MRFVILLVLLVTLRLLHFWRSFNSVEVMWLRISYIFTQSSVVSSSSFHKPLLLHKVILISFECSKF